MNKVMISELKLEISQLKQAHYVQDATMKLMNAEHSQHLESLEEGHANCITDITSLPADDLRKKGARMKAMARNMSSDRNASNKVSFAAHIDMDILFSLSLNANHSVLPLSHFPTLTNIVYCQCHYR